MNKKDYINEYLKLKEALKRIPKSTEFYSLESVVKNQFIKTFGSNSYSKLQIEAGDKASKLNLQRTELNDILVEFGNLLLKTKNKPTHADWAYYECKPVSLRSSPTGITWKQLPFAFLKFGEGKEEWIESIKVLNDNGI